MQQHYCLGQRYRRTSCGGHAEGTSHPANKVVGRLRPTSFREFREIMGRKVAVNAVMAGAEQVAQCDKTAVKNIKDKGPCSYVLIRCSMSNVRLC